MKKIINIQSKLIKNYSMVSFFLILMMIGMSLNFLVISNNGGKMPVLSSFQVTKEGYFDYQSALEVNYSLLTDRINHPFGTASIGDIFIVGGIFGLIISSFLISKNNFKLVRLKKIEKILNNEKIYEKVPSLRKKAFE